MKKQDIHRLTVADLIQHFAEVCISQNKALFDDEIGDLRA
jgi:hypothetical protein